MLRCASEIEQAALFQGFVLNLSPFAVNGAIPAEVDIGWCQVSEALVVATVVVVIDEGFDRFLKRTWQVVVLQKDAVLEGLVPSLDLALGLRVVRGATDMFHLPMIEPLGQIMRDVGRSIVGKQAWFVPDVRRRAA